MNTIALLDNLDKPLGVKFGGWDETLDYIGLHWITLDYIGLHGFDIRFETSFWVVKLLKTQFWGHLGTHFCRQWDVRKRRRKDVQASLCGDI